MNGHKMCVGMYMYDGFIVYDFMCDNMITDN